MRQHGEVYIPYTENKHLHKAQIIDGKRYGFSAIYLNKTDANRRADKYRKNGHLARVILKTVITHKFGYELGYDKVQGYVVYWRAAGM